MINLDEISKSDKAIPLYCHPSVLLHLRKNNLLDFVTLNQVDYRTIREHLLVSDNNSPDYRDYMTAEDLVDYSKRRHALLPSHVVTEYRAQIQKLEDEWKAKSFIYRFRVKLNYARLDAIHALVSNFEKFLYFTTGWIGKGL
jgi:hypothetical protein